MRFAQNISAHTQRARWFVFSLYYCPIESASCTHTHTHRCRRWLTNFYLLIVLLLLLTTIAKNEWCNQNPPKTIDSVYTTYIDIEIFGAYKTRCPKLAPRVRLCLYARCVTYAWLTCNPTFVMCVWRGTCACIPGCWVLVWIGGPTNKSSIIELNGRR